MANTYEFVDTVAKAPFGPLSRRGETTIVMRALLPGFVLAAMLCGTGRARDAIHFLPDTDPSRIAWSMMRATLGPSPDVRGKRFGIVLKTQKNEYWRQIAAGYRRRAAIDGVKLDIQAAQNESDPLRQFAIMETMIGGFYEALLISPQSSTNLQPAVEDAAMAKLPLVDVDGAVVDSVPHFVGPSNREVGQRVAKWFVEHYPGGGKVAVVQGQAGVYSTTQRTAGFVDELAKAGTFEVVATVPGNWDGRQSYEAATTVLNATPDLVGLYCNNDTMALGAMDAVRDLHRQDKVHVFGTDGTTEAYASIKAGDMTGTVDIFPILTSDIGLEVAERLSVGQTVPRVVETPQALVTRENIERYAGGFDAIRTALIEDAARDRQAPAPAVEPNRR